MVTRELTYRAGTGLGPTRYLPSWMRTVALPGVRASSSRTAKVPLSEDPAARVKATRGSVRRRCFITDGERLILPAFGAYAGGLNVRDKAFAGMFARSPIIGALGVGRVHAVGWRSLVGD